MRCSGRKADRRRAIKPEAVKTAVTRVPISAPAKAAASHNARLTLPDCFTAHFAKLSTRISLPASAVSIMRAMVDTAAKG